MILAETKMMNLVGQVVGMNEAPRGDAADISITLAITGVDNPDLNVQGAYLKLVLPRVIGVRYSFGENIRIAVEEIH